MGRTSDANERLLAAALDLIWTSSYGSVSVDDICEKAGVSKGSFYHFFASKSDLALAAYEEHWREMQPRWDQVFSVQIPPLQRLEGWCQAIYEAQYAMYQKHGRVCGCPFANLGSELSTQDEKLRAKSQEMFQRGARYIHAAISDAIQLKLIESIDPTVATQQVSALVLGQMLQAKVHNNPQMLRDLSANVLGVLRAKKKAA